MRCNNCGYIVEKGLLFCPSCGTDISEQTETQSLITEHEEVVQNDNKEKTRYVSNEVHTEFVKSEQQTANSAPNFIKQQNNGQGYVNQQGQQVQNSDQFNQQWNHYQNNGQNYTNYQNQTTQSNNQFNQQGNYYQNNGQYYSNPQYYAQNVSKPTIGMAWHKFLIYFALIAFGILLIIGGINWMNGGQYEGAKEFVYEYYEDLVGLDIAYGIAVITLGIYALTARSALAKYKEVGPKKLTRLYVSFVIVEILHTMIRKEIIGISHLNNDEKLNMIIKVVVYLALIIINIYYYKNRKHLFYN